VTPTHFDRRVIPLLLIHRGGVYKTTRFGEPRYIGDPLNAISIFNEKRVDEIAVFDIDATPEGRGPNLDFVRDFASECFVPVCYGGGVSTIGHMHDVLSIGVEKLSIGSAQGDSKLISEGAKRFGSQSIVVTLDVGIGPDGKPQIFTERGRKPTGLDPVTAARRVADLGAGEIVVQSIERDGTMQGYDRALIRSVAGAVSVPVVAAGGARDLDDIAGTMAETGASAAIAGSLFVYVGRLKGVLITFPQEDERSGALDAAMQAAQGRTIGEWT